MNKEKSQNEQAYKMLIRVMKKVKWCMCMFISRWIVGKNMSRYCVMLLVRCVGLREEWRPLKEEKI